MDQQNAKQEVVLVGRPEVTLSGRTSVVLTDVDIPFGSLVVLLVKLAVAAIPAAIVVTLLGGFAVAVFTALFYSAR